MPTSPMIRAIDLMRINVHAMSLDELEELADEMFDTISDLNDYINRPGFRTADERRNAITQWSKLQEEVNYVASLIEGAKAVAACIAKAQAAGSATHTHSLPHAGL
jgi:hypothetical protein